MYWSDYSLSPERVAQLHKTCRHMNHFPAMHCITQKISLALNVGRMRKLFPGEFEYIPMTFTDHREYVQHMAERSTQREAGGPSWYIVKPNTGAMGLGITLTSAPTVRDFNNCVVQQVCARRPPGGRRLIDWAVSGKGIPSPPLLMPLWILSLPGVLPPLRGGNSPSPASVVPPPFEAPSAQVTFGHRNFPA